MALAPTQQLSTPFEDFPGFFLKFYEQGTENPLSMATDSTGGTLLAKAEISSGGVVPIGFIKTAGDAIFIPYLSEAYDGFLIPTAAEADANDLSNAIQVADNIFFLQEIEAAITLSVQGLVISFDTVADMVASTTLSIGDIVETAGYRVKGDPGSNRYEIVAAGTDPTPDNGSFIDLDTLQAKALFPGGLVLINHFGADELGVIDSTVFIQTAWDFTPNAGTIRAAAGIYVLSDTIDRVQAVTDEHNAIYLDFDFGTIFRQTSTVEDTLNFDTKLAVPGPDASNFWGIRNLIISQDAGATAGKGIRISGFMYGLIQNVHVIGAGERGFSIEQTIVNTFINCTAGKGNLEHEGLPASQPPQYGVVIENFAGAASNINTFINFEASRCSVVGIWLKDNGRGNSFIDCLAEECKQGLLIDSQEQDYTIQNMWLESNGKNDITAATQANPVQITTLVDHGYSNGDQVDIVNPTGMLQIEQRRYIVANAVGNTFDLTDIDGVNVDGTNFDPYISGATCNNNYKILNANGHATFNGDIRWITRPRGELRNNGAQTIPDGIGVDTLLIHDVVPDNVTSVSLSSVEVPSRAIATIPGKYEVSASATFDADAVGIRRLFFKKTINGTTTTIPIGGGNSTNALTTGPTELSATVSLLMEAGDFVEAFVHQTSGGPLNVQALRTLTIDFIDYRLN